MDFTKMVSNLLDDKVIEAGRELISSLHDAHVDLRAALWLFYGDSHTWKLVISAPQFSAQGPKEAYQFIQSSAKHLAAAYGDVFSVTDVSLIGDNSELLRSIRKAIGTGQDVKNKRVPVHLLEDILIEDLYVYFLLPESNVARSRSGARFEVYRDKAGEYRFRLKAANGQVILASEGYKKKSSAMNAIASVKRNAYRDDRYMRKASQGGRFFFNLKSSNGQVIGTSTSYESESGRNKGIKTTQENALFAGVDEHN